MTLEEVLIDDIDTFNEAKEFTEAVIPDHTEKGLNIMMKKLLVLFNEYPNRVSN